MKILDLYIARVIVIGAFMALMVLTSLDLFFALIGELEDVGKGQYGYIDAVYYIVLTLPSQIYELFPAAVLVGSLMSLGSLAGGSELVAMRAAGVSVGRIVRSAMQAGLALMVVLILLGEFLVPVSEQYAQQLRSQKQNPQLSLSGRNGFWGREGNYFVNVGTVYPDSSLRNVTVYQVGDQRQLVAVTAAESAVIKGPLWELRNVRRTLLSSTEIKNEILEDEVWPALVDSSILSVLSLKPETMSIRELYRYADYLWRNKLDASLYWLAFWLKITTPLSCVVMMLIVMPFVFGSLRSVNAGQLLVIGILLGLGFYILIQVASRVGQIYAVPPFLSAVFPIVFFMLMGLAGLRKIR